MSGFGWMIVGMTVGAGLQGLFFTALVARAQVRGYCFVCQRETGGDGDG